MKYKWFALANRNDQKQYPSECIVFFIPKTVRKRSLSLPFNPTLRRRILLGHLDAYVRFNISLPANTIPLRRFQHFHSLYLPCEAEAVSNASPASPCVGMCWNAFLVVSLSSATSCDARELLKGSKISDSESQFRCVLSWIGCCRRPFSTFILPNRAYEQVASQVTGPRDRGKPCGN